MHPPTTLALSRSILQQLDPFPIRALEKGDTHDERMSPARGIDRVVHGVRQHGGAERACARADLVYLGGTQAEMHEGASGVLGGIRRAGSRWDERGILENLDVGSVATVEVGPALHTLPGAVEPFVHGAGVLIPVH